MLTTEELDLAGALGDADPYCYIQAIAQAAGLKVLIVGRDEVARRVGRALADEEWWDLCESEQWTTEMEKYVSAAPFIEWVLAAISAGTGTSDAPPS